jgi:hypothetical protein
MIGGYVISRIFASGSASDLAGSECAALYMHACSKSRSDTGRDQSAGATTEKIQLGDEQKKGPSGGSRNCRQQGKAIESVNHLSKTAMQWRVRSQGSFRLRSITRNCVIST